MEHISLKEVTAQNREAVLGLSVTDQQRPFIAENAKALRQAAEVPEAWLRAIYADDVAVGMVLLHDEHLRDHPREDGYYFLWRLMIDSAYQGRGYGRGALDLVLEHVKTGPHARRLLSSYLPGSDGPGEFYRCCGFRRTGKTIEGEVEIEIDLEVTNAEEGGGQKR